jgi:hypothetical protein
LKISMAGAWADIDPSNFLLENPRRLISRHRGEFRRAEHYRQATPFKDFKMRGRSETDCLPIDI